MASDFIPSDSEHDIPAPPSAGEFTQQLLTQLYADLDQVLSEDFGTLPVKQALMLLKHVAASGGVRAASLYIMSQAAVAAFTVLVGESETLELPASEDTADALLYFCADAEPHLAGLARHAQRLTRYAAEAEPAAPRALPLAIAQAIIQLYHGMMNADSGLGGRGLISLRTLLAHCDAIATTLDPAEGNDRPVRVFAPDRFHDHFLFLTQQIQQTPTGAADQPVATLTRDGRLTALITTAGHPLEEAAQAVRNRVPGDPTTKEHALLRMQGLLRTLDEARLDPTHPLAAAVTDDRARLALITAAATCPMQRPGSFGLPQLMQIYRYNHRLLGQPLGAEPNVDPSGKQAH